MGYVILLWHSLSLPYNIFSNKIKTNSHDSAMSQTKANDYFIDQQLEETFVINLAHYCDYDSSNPDIALPLTKEDRRRRYNMKTNKILKL